MVDFTEKIRGLSDRIPKVVGLLETEEATKNALVMPFISALGYDVFNPQEVVPEFTADVGTKKGEKVDYAIKRDSIVIILIEAKRASETLNETHLSQLYRYFSVTKARIAILTNGIIYRFYSDLEEPNKMDAKPFLEIDMRDLRENLLAELKKLTKDSFDLDHMLSAASDLKHMREIRQVFEEQFETPHEDFVAFFFRQASPGGRFGQSAKEQFTRLVKKTIGQSVSDRVGDRLRSALVKEDITSGRVAPPPESTAQTPIEDATENEAAEDDEPRKPGVETTEEELDGFRIVKAIVCRVLAPERISHRDTKSYFGVLCDNNNRKPICRLHFNSGQKYLGLLDEEKTETRHPIDSPESIYKFADALTETAKRYMEA